MKTMVASNNAPRDKEVEKNRPDPANTIEDSSAANVPHQDPAIKYRQMKLKYRLLQEEYSATKRERDRLQRRLDYMENSLSWRFFSPARKVLKFFKKTISTQQDPLKAEDGRLVIVDAEELQKHPVLVAEVLDADLFQIRRLNGDEQQKLELLFTFNLHKLRAYLAELIQDLPITSLNENEKKHLTEISRWPEKGVPGFIFTAKINRKGLTVNISEQLANSLDALKDKETNLDETSQVKLSQLLAELGKVLLKDHVAQYKLAHLLLAYVIRDDNIPLARLHLRLALAYPGFALATRLRTSFFAEGLGEVLDAVEADENWVTGDDLQELIAALLYVSGYRKIALKLLDPFAENAKRTDLRLLAYCLTIPTLKLIRFLSSRQAEESLSRIDGREYGRAERLFCVLRARYLNLDKWVKDADREKPLLPEISPEANQLLLEILRKVQRYYKEGRYPVPSSLDAVNLDQLDHPPWPVRKIFVSGFGWSGSSALSDLIKDCEGIGVMPGPGKHELINLGAEDETTIFENVGSLSVLWDHFILDVKKSNALLDFVRLHVLGILPRRAMEMKACFWTRSMLRKYDLHYYVLVDHFLHDLLGNPSASLDEKKESFVRFTNRLIHLVALDQGCRVMLFDNAIKAQNMIRLEMIGEATCAVVARDPDDQFISMQNENMYVTRSPEMFVDMQYDKVRAFVEGADQLKHNDRIKVYAIFFEDLVQKGTEWRQRLLRELLGEEIGLPDESDPNARFKPAESAKNIGQFEREGKRYATEMGLTKEVYAAVLADYLWQYDPAHEL